LVLICQIIAIERKPLSVYAVEESDFAAEKCRGEILLLNFVVQEVISLCSWYCGESSGCYLVDISQQRQNFPLQSAR
jgi:hypothetical protein